MKTNQKFIDDLKATKLAADFERIDWENGNITYESHYDLDLIDVTGNPDAPTFIKIEGCKAKEYAETIQRALEIAELVAGGGGEELLPCPCCDAEMEERQNGHITTKEHPLNDSGSIHTQCPLYGIKIRLDDKDKVKKWNTRHNPAQALIEGAE